MRSHKHFALIGFIFLLPFAVVNFIVSLKPEPVYSFLDSTLLLSESPWPVIILMLLIFVGAIIAIYPILKKDAGGRRNWHSLNIVTGLILLLIFVALSIVLGEEIYRCDILHIPNCD